MGLGLEIGVVKTTCKTTIAGGGTSVTNTIYVDFSTASDTDIKNWLVSNRVIAGQRPWKNLTEDELKDLDGKTFVAQTIGTKVKTREEQVQALESAGLPRNLAEFAVDNPAEFAKVTQTIKTVVEEEPTIMDSDSPKYDE